jgi:hypothetical protein
MRTYESEIEVGARYRDTVSGWEGVATAVYFYMNGCVRVEISHRDKDGKPEGYVFDEQQVEAVASKKPAAKKPAKAAVGGPRDSAPVPR